MCATWHISQVRGIPQAHQAACDRMHPTKSLLCSTGWDPGQSPTSCSSSLLKRPDAQGWNCKRQASALDPTPCCTAGRLWGHVRHAASWTALHLGLSAMLQSQQQQQHDAQGALTCWAPQKTMGSPHACESINKGSSPRACTLHLALEP